MARLLCRLANMPLDEKLEVLNVLDEHGIHYFETHAGFWGVGVAAIWLSDPSQYLQAQKLFDDYQQTRLVLMHDHADHDSLTIWLHFLRAPMRFLVSVIALLAILCLSIYPFML